MKHRPRSSMKLKASTDQVAFFAFDRYQAMPQPAAVQNTEQPGDTIPVEETIGASIDYVKWGDDNLRPNQMVADIKNCGILTGGIDIKVRFGLGAGPRPFKLLSTDAHGNEQLEAIQDPEIEDWMLENNFYASCYGWLRDLTALGQSLCRMKFDRLGKKIGLMWRHDVAEMRMGKKNNKGYSTKIYLSALWDKGVNSGQEKNQVIPLTLVPTVGPINYLKEQKNLASKEFAFVTRLPDWLKHYYSDPNWMAAKNWVEIAKGVPEMKAYMFENNIRAKYIVVFMDEYWSWRFPDWDDSDEAKCESYRNEVYDEFDKFLTGSKNAYKSLFVDGKTVAASEKYTKYVYIEAVKDETKQGELLPDSAAANFEILFSIAMSPALIGMNVLGGGQYGGGAGSGSDIREAGLIQVMVQNYERYTIQRKLAIVSEFNGWKAKYPQLVWRFPGQVLTTLDKGKSTEPVQTQ